MKIRGIWKTLEEDAYPASSGYITRLILPELKYDVYLAVEKPDNRRLLMIRFKCLLVDRNLVYPSFNCFKVRRVVLPDDESDSDRFTLQLILTKPAYEDIFTALVEDILNNLASIEEEQNAIAEFITRLQRWQKFLEKHDRNGLSQMVQQGLYGELWFLREIVIPQLGCNRGVQSWTGARGSQQDFQFKQCAVEVKTTATKKHQIIAIASEKQLDDTGIANLILLHLSLDIRQVTGQSLPEIVASVRTLIANDVIAKENLEILLFEAGYLDIHATRYEQTRYTIREINYFQVEEDFPRIVEADLRNGVGNVRYTIAVDQCKKFSISQDRVTALILGGKS